MSPEDGRRPNVEPSQIPEVGGENRLAFLIAAALCVASGITGLSVGNPVGGCVALGVGVLSALEAIRS